MCNEGVDIGVIYEILFLTAGGVHSYSFAAGDEQCFCLCTALRPKSSDLLRHVCLEGAWRSQG